MKFDDVLHYELYFCVNRINQSICPSQYLLASTDDTTLWLTCFCSFSLVCSPLLLPVVHSLSIYLRFLWFSLGSEIKFKCRSVLPFHLPSTHPFFLYLKNTPPPFRQFTRTSISLLVSLSVSLNCCYPHTPVHP